jgi:CMP-N,N'-diacetyllegionaminic acid synthase
MKIMIVIPARKNSKRLKNKNLQKLGNNSLIENTIFFVKNNFKNFTTLVSTDSKKMRSLSLKQNILCPWLRPKKLSGDKASSISVLKHALSWSEKKFDTYDAVLLLQPTTPFRKYKDIKFCINKFYTFENFKNISIISVKSKNKNFTKKKIFNLEKNKDFLPNGSFYLIGVNQIKRNQIIGKKNTFGYLIKSKKYNLDIDKIEDLDQARRYL